MLLMPAPKSVKSCRICFFPVASPHFGKNTCASSANKSMMLPPVDVTPLLSNALRYSSATDLRCSSVIVIFVTAIGGLLLLAFQFLCAFLPVGHESEDVFLGRNRREGFEPANRRRADVSER